jgi:uncharacterized membrane protein YbhN (UPF0104 family)
VGRLSGAARRVVTLAGGRRVWGWVRVLAAVGILGALGWRLGTAAFLAGLRAITPGSVLVALGVGALTTVCCAARWCLVARELGLPLRLRTAVADYYRSQLLNAVLPAGVLGDVHRAVSHGQRSGDLPRGVRAVVFERAAGQVVLVAVGLAVLVARPLPTPTVPGWSLLAALVGLAVAGVLGARSARVRRVVRATWVDARAGLFGRRALPGVTLLSAATVVGHVAVFVVAARAAGVTAPLGRLVPLLVLALLVMAVPVNVGGFGPREAFLAAAFGTAGLGGAQGVATAVGYGVLGLVASLPGLAVLAQQAVRARRSETAPFGGRPSRSDGPHPARPAAVAADPASW